MGLRRFGTSGWPRRLPGWDRTGVWDVVFGTENLGSFCLITSLKTGSEATWAAVGFWVEVGSTAESCNMSCPNSPRSLPWLVQLALSKAKTQTALHDDKHSANRRLGRASKSPRN